MELLKKHFDIAIESPDGIKKLRELILTLAMQGKLVKQDPNDQPASELLKEIQVEKKQLIAEGKIKKQKELPEIKPEEVPYEVPKGWVWTRLGNITHEWGQKKPDKSFTYIDVGSIDNKKGVIINEPQVIQPKDAPSRARKIVKLGTVIYSTVRPYLLNIAIVEKEYLDEPIASTAFAVMHPYKILNVKFLYQYLNSQMFITFVKNKQKGAAYPAISDGDFFKGLLPLPPLAEQKRIVAKIDELMALCDKLEKQRINRDHKRLAAHSAVINRLLNTADQKEFNSSWQFITRHFTPLYSVKENVAELKKAILTLAMQGKLVKQDLNDQPASELLKEIQAEKERLIAEGKIKKQKELPEIKPEEVPYKVPKGWAWTRLGTITDINMGQSPDGKSYNEIGNGVPLINGPVEFGGKGPFDLTVATKFTTSPTKMCSKGDLLLCVRGSTTGRTNIAGFDSCIGRGVASLKPYIYSQFLNQFILTLRNRWIEISTGSTFPNISQEKINIYLFPLPPLAEQKRIVTKIDELMALCDKLEKQIDQATAKQTALFDAVLAQV